MENSISSSFKDAAENKVRLLQDIQNFYQLEKLTKGFLAALAIAFDYKTKGTFLKELNTSPLALLKFAQGKTIAANTFQRLLHAIWNRIQYNPTQTYEELAIVKFINQALRVEFLYPDNNSIDFDIVYKNIIEELEEKYSVIT